MINDGARRIQGFVPGKLRPPGEVDILQQEEIIIVEQANLVEHRFSISR